MKLQSLKLPPLKPCAHPLPAEEFGSKSDLLADLGRSNEPIALMLTCWELGCAPDEVSIANPGEIMIVQNPGGVVPAAQMRDRGTALGSVIYSLHQAKIRHLIVCGHTHCQTLGLILAKEQDHKNNPFHGLMHGLSDRFQKRYSDRPTQEWLRLIVQEAILQQLANLRSHSHIKSRLQRGDLFLHGWIRDDTTAAITSYDPATGQFQG